MPTTVTKRISATAAGGQTARVSEAPVASATLRVTEAVAQDMTARITGAPTGSDLTSRLSFLLLLEGDESGVLLLEGDMQDIGTDALKLEGDATTIGGTTTKRILEAVE